MLPRVPAGLIRRARQGHYWRRLLEQERGDEADEALPPPVVPLADVPMIPAVEPDDAAEPSRRAAHYDRPVCVSRAPGSP